MLFFRQARSFFCGSSCSGRLFFFGFAGGISSCLCLFTQLLSLSKLLLGHQCFLFGLFAFFRQACRCCIKLGFHAGKAVYFLYFGVIYNGYVVDVRNQIVEISRRKKQCNKRFTFLLHFIQRPYGGIAFFLLFRNLRRKLLNALLVFLYFRLYLRKGLLRLFIRC